MKFKPTLWGIYSLLMSIASILTCMKIIFLLFKGNGLEQTPILFEGFVLGWATISGIIIFYESGVNK